MKTHLVAAEAVVEKKVLKELQYVVG